MVSPSREVAFDVLWQNKHILIHHCVCWFIRTPCTLTHTVNIVMDQWSVALGMHKVLASRKKRIQDNKNAHFWFIPCTKNATTHQRGRELALANDFVMHDTILLPTNVGNICSKRVENLWTFSTYCQHSDVDK